MILPEVDETLLEVIRENLESVPKNSVVIRPSEKPPRKTPAVYVWNRAFTASYLGIGASAPDTGEVVVDEFDGDGNKTSFRLSNLPLRPLWAVEAPRNKQNKEGKDFAVDYTAGMLKFSEAPEKGKRNILIRYGSGKRAGEVKGLRLRLTYHIDIWASDPKEEGSITNQVASLLLKTREFLLSKGIDLRLVRGRDLTAKDGIPEGVLCRRLECLAEANMMVRTSIPRIENVRVQKIEETSKL